MLKLATVFSGIGAIEHALERMGIKYEIAFACDNGDVDILSKKITSDLFKINEEIILLKSIISNLDITLNDDYDYFVDLESHLHKINEKVSELEIELNKSFNSKFLINICTDILTKICNLTDIEEDLKQNYIKKSKLFSESVSNILNYSSLSSEKIEACLSYVTLIYLKDLLNEFKKLNLEFIFDSLSQEILIVSSKLSHKNLKIVIQEVKELCDNLGMLHEKIETLNILNKLSKIKHYDEKKKFVDDLYKNKEKSNFVKQSYFANYNITEDKFHWNVSFLDGTQYRDKVDLFVGGSPCQSFSMVGKRRGLADTRGTLFYEYARLVKEIRPKVFIYENVKAVLSNDEGRTWQTMSQIFNDLNYTWKYTTLNAKDYGIPQNRERIFVVGFRNDLMLTEEFSFPESINLDKTMKDFLIDNVSGKYYLNKKGVKFVTDDKNIKKRYTQIDGNIQLCQKKNQQFNWHGDFVFVEENIDKEKTIHDLEKYFLSEKVKKYVLATGTKNFYSKPEIDLDIARPLLTTMHKMHRAGVDNYVTTEGRLRKLTPRECLRLMGFCDSFKIVVSDTQMYQQAGNSIVVNVLIHIMNSIIKCLPEIITGENYKYNAALINRSDATTNNKLHEQIELIALDKS